MNRTWEIALPCGPLLNKNDHRHKHWGKRDRITNQLRGEAMVIAKAQKIPPMQRSHIYAFVIPPDKKRRDPANWYDSAKACVDGIKDAGVWPDDNPTYVTGPDMRLGEPRTCPKCRERNVHLTLYIREI